MKFPQHARDALKEPGCVFLAPHHPPAGPATFQINSQRFLISFKGEENGGR
jgi:hypothetical protein